MAVVVVALARFAAECRSSRRGDRPYAGRRTRSSCASLCTRPALSAAPDALGQLSCRAARVHVELRPCPWRRTLEETCWRAGLAATRWSRSTARPRRCRRRRAPGCSTCSSAPGSTRHTRAARRIRGACACQLTGGEVDGRDEVLEAADIADGYILAYQAVPLTPEVSISYGGGTATLQCTSSQNQHGRAIRHARTRQRCRGQTPGPALMTKEETKTMRRPSANAPALRGGDDAGPIHFYVWMEIWTVRSMRRSSPVGRRTVSGHHGDDRSQSSTCAA